MENTETENKSDSVADVFAILLLIALLVSGFYFIILGSDKVVKRSDIKYSMINLIKQGGDIRAVKQMYVNRKIER